MRSELITLSRRLLSASNKATALFSEKDMTCKNSQIQVGWTRSSTLRDTRQIGFTAPATSGSSRHSRRKRWLITDEESHLITFAPTGFGKGRSAIIPSLLKYPGSMLVIDPKGEAATVTARRRRELGNDVVIIDPFKISTDTPDTFNPFDAINTTDMGIEEFSLLFPHLLHPDSGKGLPREPFWDIKGDDLIAGITAMILSVCPEEERNISKLRQAIKSGDVIMSLANQLDTVGAEMSPMAYENIAALVSTEDKCRSSILATAQQHFSIYADPKVIESMSTTSFDLEQFREGNQPMTIYLVLPVTRLYSHATLLRIWLSTLIAVLKSRKARPQYSTLLIVDEAAQLGRMTSLLECMTLLRGYGVRVWSFWQSMHQLYHLYGDEAEVILDNCGVIQTLGCNHNRNAKALSDMFGDNSSPEEFLSLPRGQQMVMTPKGRLEQLGSLDYLKDQQYKGHFDPNPLYNTSKWTVRGTTKMKGRSAK